jgi:hypothetical protein
MQPQPDQTTVSTSIATESLDGDGAADHDQPYQCGRRPNLGAPFPFTVQQYARLLVLRSRVQAGLIDDDGYTAPMFA